MTDKVKPVPDGYPTLTPYMIFKDASAAIEFYKKAFGATETIRVKHPDGKIMHAEIRIGTSPLMMVDENIKFPEMQSPETYKGSPIQLYFYTEDVDALAERAIAAGAKLIAPIQDAADGDRRGGLEDPFGYTWWVASQIKKVAPEELQ